MKNKPFYGSFVAKKVHDAYWGGFFTGLAVVIWVIAVAVIVAAWAGGYV